MGFVIVDLEATCWPVDKEFQRANSEIIEIGAIRANDNCEVISSFDRIIRPVNYPLLTDFCVELTGITQEQVDAARTLDEVAPEFKDWTGGTHIMVSWGNYDMKFLHKNWPVNLRFPFKRHINLKQAFGQYEGSRPKGLSRAISSLGWTFEGRHHNGYADALNTYKIFKHLNKEAPHVLSQA